MKFKNINIGLKWRIVTLFILIFAITLIIFSSLLYKEFERIQIIEFDTILYNFTVDIAESISLDDTGAFALSSEIIKVKEKILPFSFGATHISILDESGAIVSQTNIIYQEKIPDLKNSEINIVFKKGHLAKTFELSGNKYRQKFRMMNYIMPLPNTNIPYILQVVVPLNLFETIKERYFELIIIAVPVILLISLISGVFFADLVLAPIKTIIEETNNIKTTELSKRIYVPNIKDEQQELAQTINNFLDRIEKSFNSQERFIQHASHQLKTPLAILKNEIDFLNKSEKSEEEISQFLISAKEEINSLINLNNNLLLLARADAGLTHLTFRPIRIDEILVTQIERLNSLIKNKMIQLSFNIDQTITQNENALTIQGDSELIGALFFNLIENAIKYSNPNGKVDIYIKPDLENIIVEIHDDGIGLSIENSQKLYERFYREHSSEVEKREGHGLGLSICKSVVDLHNGKMTLATKSIGTKAIVELKNLL